MQIRPVKTTDYQEVISIQNSFWEPETSPIYDKIWTESDIINRIDLRSNFLVAIIDDKIAGVLSYSPYYPFDQGNHVGTFGLVVHPNFTKKGVGKGLITHFISLAPELGFKKIAMHVTGGNQPALSLYENLGFSLEACLKRNLYIKGKYQDALIFGLWLE